MTAGFTGNSGTGKRDAAAVSVALVIAGGIAAGADNGTEPTRGARSGAGTARDGGSGEGFARVGGGVAVFAGRSPLGRGITTFSAASVSFAARAFPVLRRVISR